MEALYQGLSQQGDPDSFKPIHTQSGKSGKYFTYKNIFLYNNHTIPQNRLNVGCYHGNSSHGNCADIDNIPILHKEMLYFDLSRTSYHSIPLYLPIVSDDTMLKVGVVSMLILMIFLFYIGRCFLSSNTTPSYRINEYHGDNVPWYPC